MVEETGSTNADLLARAAAGEDIDGAVLIAGHQTAGRGRNGRQWFGAPGAQLALSVAVDAAPVPSERWGWLTLAAGVAVVDTVAAVTGVRTGLKWPNDVLTMDGDAPRKLAGILAEVAAPQSLIVVGIGLNVTLRGVEVADLNAASLAELAATSTDRGILARRLLTELADRVRLWRDGSDTLAADYRRRSVTLGSRVRAVLPGDRAVEGTARDIDDQGRLQIDTGTESITVSAGDIIHLRAP